MKKQLIFLTSIILSFLAHAQAPDIAWQKTFGGVNSDSLYFAFQTKSGAYILAGRQNGASNIVKIDSNRDLIWDKNTLQSISNISLNNDESIMIAGSFDTTISAGVNKYHYTALLNASGEQQSKTNFRLANNSSWKSATNVKTLFLKGNHYISWGDYHDYDPVRIDKNLYYCFIQKRDSSEKSLYNYSKQALNLISFSSYPYTFSKYYYAIDAIQTKQNEFIFIGCYNYNTKDFWVVKTDSNLVVSWRKTFGGLGNDSPKSVIQTSDGSFVIVGSSTSNSGHLTTNYGLKDGWALKIDNSGAIVWQKSLGGTKDDEFNAVVELADSGLVIAGVTESNDNTVSSNKGGKDAWLLKLDANGTFLWEKTYGGSGNDLFNFLSKTSDGELLISGTTNSTDGDITINNGNYDYWVLKTGNVTTNVSNNLGSKSLLVQPNPSNGIFNFEGLGNGNTIELYDLAGNLIHFAMVNNEATSVIDLSNKADGVYFYKIIQANKSTITGKIVKR